MRVTVDTNVLVRMIVADDEDQASRAVRLFESAEAVAVGLQALAELVWVLRRSYGVSKADVGTAIRALVDTEKVVVDRAAVDAGLTVLDAGGDFADGLTAYEGAWLGGAVFVSFDAQAVALLTASGRQARLV